MLFRLSGSREFLLSLLVSYVWTIYNKLLSCSISLLSFSHSKALVCLLFSGSLEFFVLGGVLLFCFVFYLKVNAGATNHLFGCCCCCHVTKKKQKFKKIKWLIAEKVVFFVLNTVVIAYPTSSFQKENKVYFKCSFANTLQTSCNLAQYTAPKN